MRDYEKSPSTIGARRKGNQNTCETMAGEGDGSDSRYNQGLPVNELEDDTTHNTANVALTTVDQSAALTGI